MRVRLFPVRALLAFLLFMGLWLPASVPVAYGHAQLERAIPAAGSVVTEAPGAVRLTFSTDVEPAFSTFKVYPLVVGEGESVESAARKLVEEVLNKRGDEEDRVDKGLAEPRRRTREIAVPLVDELEPGHYVVMWRVLAADTHVSSGSFVFTYQP